MSSNNDKMTKVVSSVTPARPSRTPRDRFMFSRADKVYLLTVCIESILLTGLVLAPFLVLHFRVGVDMPRTRGTALYMAVFIMASLFQVLYAYDALRARSVIQLVLHLLFQLCLLAWAIGEIPQTRLEFKDINLPGACVRVSTGSGWDCLGPGSVNALMVKILIAVPILIFISLIVMAIAARHLYNQFGWAVFEKVHASPQMKRMLRNYETYMSLLKLLFFFATAFCMVYIIIVPMLWRRTAELILTAVALPIYYPGLIACAWAVKREHYPVMILGLIIMIVGEAYFIWKLANLWLPATAPVYATTQITLSVFASFTVFINAVGIVYGAICLSQFNKGLRQANMDVSQDRWWRSRKYDEGEMEIPSNAPFLID